MGEKGGAIVEADILFFSGEHSRAMGLYQRLEEEILRRVPGVAVKTARTQITFANSRGFAFASFLPVRPAARRPKPYLTVSFGLGCRKESPRIDAAVEPYPNRWTHHVMIGSEEEIDAELLDWIAEAAAFSRAKR